VVPIHHQALTIHPLLSNITDVFESHKGGDRRVRAGNAVQLTDLAISFAEGSA
jgi:hypothetical protein